MDEYGNDIEKAKKQKKKKKKNQGWVVFNSKMYDLDSTWEFIKKGGKGVEIIQAIKCN